jgi:hypothetical protein
MSIVSGINRGGISRASASVPAKGNTNSLLRGQDRPVTVEDDYSTYFGCPGNWMGPSWARSGQHGPQKALSPRQMARYTNNLVLLIATPE